MLLSSSHFLCTQRCDTLLQASGTLLPMRMICWKIISMEYAASSQGKKLDCLETVCTAYGNRLFWKDSCMSKDRTWKVTLCFLSVWILYILKDSLKARLYCTLVTELLPSPKVMLHFPRECVLWKWLFFFQTECLNRVWSENCFAQRTLHSRARVIA